MELVASASESALVSVLRLDRLGFGLNAAGEAPFTVDRLLGLRGPIGPGGLILVVLLRELGTGSITGTEIGNEGY